MGMGWVMWKPYQAPHKWNDGQALDEDGERHHPKSDRDHGFTIGHTGGQAQSQGQGKRTTHPTPEEDVLMSGLDVERCGGKERCQGVNREGAS